MKYKMRDIRHADMNGYIEGDTEQMFRNVETPNVVDEVISKLDKERLLSALNCLSENQKRRITLYYFQGLTYRQIARIDGVSDMSVRESIAGAIKKLKKVFINTPLKHPLSVSKGEGANKKLFHSNLKIE